MTGSGWELAIVAVLSSGAFFTVWHFVAQLIG
jgi:hypothetical protein